jgi:hypothetical protein
MSARVYIQDDSPYGENIDIAPPSGLVARPVSDTTDQVELAWEALVADDEARNYMFYINDFPLGYVDATQCSLVVQDIESLGNLSFTAYGVSAEGHLGKRYVTVTLAPDDNTNDDPADGDTDQSGPPEDDQDDQDDQDEGSPTPPPDEGDEDADGGDEETSPGTPGDSDDSDDSDATDDDEETDSEIPGDTDGSISPAETTEPAKPVSTVPMANVFDYTNLSQAGSSDPETASAKPVTQETQPPTAETQAVNETAPKETDNTQQGDSVGWWMVDGWWLICRRADYSRCCGLSS